MHQAFCVKKLGFFFLECYSTFFPFFIFFSPAPSLTIELNVSVTIRCVVLNFMFGNPAVKIVNFVKLNRLTSREIHYLLTFFG